MSLLKATRRKLLNFLITPLLAGLVLTILAPLGTHNLTFAGRAFYWIGLCVAGGLGAGVFDIINSKFKLTSNLWLTALAHSIGSTLAVATFIFSLFEQSTLPSAVVTLFYIWVIAIVISGIGALMRRRDAPEVTAHSRPALYDRLAPKLRSAEIYAIVSEDHYVRIYTSAGEDMILMRLSDAIKETAPLPGVTPHRSWWVGEAGVESTKRKEGKTIMTLKNGIVVPVSRNGAKTVREAGWV
jgi:DNA-binding LytR/AlgR family response regulator